MGDPSPSGRSGRLSASAITTTRIPAGNATRPLATLQTIPAASLPPAFLPPIRALHAACFPEDAADMATAPDAAFLERLAWLHEPAECVWVLCWGGAGPGGEGMAIDGAPPPAAPPPSSSLPPLLAMVTAVPYPASFFGFNLAVAPAWRGLGLGRRVMHEMQAAGLARFGLAAISATVDAAGAPALVRYYCGFGGVVEATGVSGPGAPPPPTVRVVRRFDERGLVADTAAADEALLARVRRRSAVRRWVRTGLVVGVGAVVVAGWRRRGGA